jgi:NADPH:quinone reductase-like Zn-dependent oxidoreductase
MDRMGAFAESVSLPARRVGRRPRGLDGVEAACLPLPGLCALAALDAGGVRPGSRVLIHGGAGGVGALAVQLASQRGAEVHATVGAADLERVRALGARRPIDRDAERFEDVARDLDLVLDTVGGETLTRSFAALRRGGTLASLHVPPPADALTAAGLRAPWLLRAMLPLVTLAPRRAAARAGVRLAPILTVPEPGALARLARAAEDPGLRVTIARVFPFEALGDAVEHLRSGAARGRVVLRRG